MKKSLEAKKISSTPTSFPKPYLKKGRGRLSSPFFFSCFSSLETDHTSASKGSHRKSRLNFFPRVSRGTRLVSPQFLFLPRTCPQMRSEHGSWLLIESCLLSKLFSPSPVLFLKPAILTNCNLYMIVVFSFSDFFFGHNL